MLKIGRNRSQREKNVDESEPSSPSSSVSSKMRFKFRKSRSNGNTDKNIFRHVASRRSLNRFRTRSTKQCLGTKRSDTFSLSEDDASNISSLFSPVNAVSPLNEAALPLLQQPTSKSPPFFISGEDKLSIMKAHLNDMESIMAKKDIEMSSLQQMIEDLKSLHSLDLELKGIELEKKDVELEKLRMELSEARFEIESQSHVIEALATAHHKQMNRNWLSSIPDLFLELI
jgi:hypothetical protein